MPSTISTSVSSAFASSTVITPSLPTFCIACAIILPMVASPLAEMVPTCATSADEPTFLARFSISLITACTAVSMPRLRSIGFIPAATALAPSRTIACANTVAVVVPSPAVSEVLLATSRTICAPMFSNLSASSISLATVTPSLLIRGAPNALSSTTLRPFGPNVTFTALASTSTPRSIRSRASPPNFTSFAAIAFSILLPHQYAHDVGLFHDHQLVAVDRDLGPGPLPEQDAIPLLHLERRHFPFLVAGAGSDRQNLTLLGLLLGRIRNDDPAGTAFLLIQSPDQNAVVQWPEFHGKYLLG